MSLYQGWNREEMQQAGAVFKDASTLQPQFVSPLKTLISRALDSDTLYDLPDEVSPRVAPPKGSKRVLTRGTKGRAVSLGAVWEDNDDEDLQYGVQRQGIEVHIPKKRKLAPLQRSKSIKAMSKTLSEFWDEGDNARQTHTHHDEQQASQLTTTPDSGKSGKKRVGNPTSQSKAKKTKPFKNPTITKPSVAKEKEYRDDLPSPKSVSIHQGWTTTQDAVKLNSNGIAKTTLDKLAAFRYKSSADAVVPITSTKLQVKYEFRSELDVEDERQLDPQELGHKSVRLGPFPSHDSPSHPPHFEPSEVQVEGGLEETEAQDPRLTHFPSDHNMLLGNVHRKFVTEALWNVRSNSQPTPSNSQNAASRHVDEPQFQQLLQPNGNIRLDPSSPQFPQGSMSISPETSALPAELTNNVANDCEPTSGEARVLRYVPDYTVINQRDQEVSERHGVETPAMQNGMIFHFEQMQVDCPHEFEMLRSFHRTRIDVEEIPLRAEFSGHHSQVHLPKSLIEVQVEGSDVHDVEAVPRDVSKDYESDEFDEGLDDDDLLAMASEPVILATQFNVNRSGRENQGVKSQTQLMDSSHAPAQNGFASSKPVEFTLEASNPDPAMENHRTRTPRVLSSDPDDEYRMDEEDEEMFKMPDLMNKGVIEQFQAPESLQFAFGNESGSGEVYDSSLQFSPPRHRPMASSQMKVPSVLHADKISTGDSPPYRSDTKLLQAGEEEDWNFIRSSHFVGDATVQVISEALSDPQPRTITDGLVRCESLSSPRLLADTIASDIAIAQTQVTQRDSASIMWILDDSHEYQPLRTFARPDFPVLTRDRSLITGVSAQTFLRVCFRIGEMFKEGARYQALKQDAVIELFARVTFSSREHGTTKQHFQFADLWHDRPPFPNGILANYKTTGLAESESKAFLYADEGMMARCLGRLKRDSKSGAGWMLHIITIRTTDWEEIKWTKRIVSAGLAKSETLGLSKF